ncbi:IS66 family transposase [Stieleria maiorica]|nr:IS66 family transposase [Stieleria maiorica]
MDELPADIDELRELVLKLASSNDQLAQTVSTQQAKLEKQEHRIAELLAALRGKQRERIDPDQLLLFEIGELEKLIEEELEESKPRRGRKKRRSRRMIPDNLPHVEVLHELPEQERLCPIDGKPMPVIRYEISKQLDYVAAQMRVIVHKRAVYACPEKHDQATLLTAPKPPEPIAKGLATAGLLAQVVVGKFGDHLPGYRLEDIFSRHGVHIRRSTIYDWLAAVSDLVEPLYELMKSRCLQSRVIHTDDTQVKLIDHAIGGTRMARFWAYLGDRGHPYTVYDFTQTRERAGPEQFLKNYEGYLQADAYGGYDGIYLQSQGKIAEVSCWAHCRRYWHKAREQDPARAHHVLGVIARLYEVERAASESDREILRSIREQHALPLLRDLKRWLDDEEFLPKSLIGKAATYTRNQWEGLNRYIESGELSIDNNRAERAMKNVALGRKAWLFVGSTEAGHRASRLMSLIASCKENHVEPWAYMRAVISGLPRGVAVETLLPDRWLADNPEHRWEIADQRKKEREAKS